MRAAVHVLAWLILLAACGKVAPASVTPEQSASKAVPSRFSEGSRSTGYKAQAVDAGRRDWVSVEANFLYSCAIRADGSLWCWGSNGGGKLGDGTTIDRDVPVPVAGGGRWSSVALADWLTCGIQTDGTTWCWGHQEGGLPRGKEDRHATAGAVPERLQLRAARSIVEWALLLPLPSTGLDLRLAHLQLGDAHACALADDHEIYCWGAREKTGGGAVALLPERTPVRVDVPSDVRPRFDSVTVGSRHACALADDGRAFCWGGNAHGQVGGGTFDDYVIRPVPVVLPGSGSTTPLRQIAAGTFHTCALATDGAIWCWGEGTGGCLGDAAGRDRNTPVRIDGSRLSAERRAVAISAGYCSTCAVLDDGELLCWGSVGGESAGPESSGAEMPAVLAVLLPDGPARFRDVSIGCNHACGLTVDGRVACWGGGEKGQSGTGSLP